MRRRQTVRGLVPAFALWLACPRPRRAQAADPVPVAAAYAAAWNAHDLEAVLALFAPDAVVRGRTGVVPAAVWDTRDPRVVRTYLDGAHDGLSYDAGGLAWMTGHQEIAAWAAGRFARNHRYAVGPPRAAGDTVGWPYRAFINPFQLVPGVGPAEGDAEAVVRGGTITVLSLVESPASVRRQRGEGEAALARVRATHRAPPLGDEAGERPSGPVRAAAAAEPTPVAWPLALGGLALLAGGTGALRRRPLP
jgi:hypothetical protein